MRRNQVRASGVDEGEQAEIARNIPGGQPRAGKVGGDHARHRKAFGALAAGGAAIIAGRIIGVA
jgi:hypothetical protein